MVDRNETGRMKFKSYAVDADSSLKVVNAAQNEVHLALGQALAVQGGHEVVEVVHRRYVVVVRLDLNVRINVSSRSKQNMPWSKPARVGRGAVKRVKRQTGRSYWRVCLAASTLLRPAWCG